MLHSLISHCLAIPLKHIKNITLPVVVIALMASSSDMAAARVKSHRSYFRDRVTNGPKSSSDPSVVNAASYLPGVSPGGLATIFGQDLSTVNGVISANTNPLPTELGGVEVVVNGILAPLLSVAYANGEDQISFQIPYETDTGPGAAEIQVLNYGNPVALIKADSFTEDPGIFTNGGYALAVRNFDGSLIGIDNPAGPGETIVLYVTGLGPVSLDVADGEAAPANPLAYTLDPFQALVNGEPCEVLFSGLAPGFVGLYQLNLALPPDLPTGDLDVQIYTPDASSGIAKLPVF